MKPPPQNILVNGISVRTGGAQTFLMNLLPRLAKITPNWTYHLLIRQDCEQLYRNLPTNVIVDAIPTKLSPHT